MTHRTSTQIQKLASVAARWEKELSATLSDSALGRDIDHAISQLRTTYQDIIFLDFDYALKQDIEGKIWDKHHKIIGRYRSNINHLRDPSGKKKPVEIRKTMSHFVNFLKATTRFYRSFIQRLASHFSVYELEPVVRQFKLFISNPDEPVVCSPEKRFLIIQSCHRSLVILGDLSRYREISSGATKNWAPATGYYDLAKKLLPDSGSPHNQLAVISMSDGSNFSATYHLYRALCVRDPFAEAGNNLYLGFMKILKAYKSGKLGSNLLRKEEQAVSELLSLFVRFHAKCYIGKEFSELEALQEEMLAQLNMDLKERLLSEGMLNKLALINISAQAYVGKRLSGHEALQAVASFLRLNVETFNTLLLIFQPELERAVTNGGKPGNSAECISAVGRRMLPALRLYSKWLLINYPVLTNQLDDTTLAVQIKQLWQTYANTLSLLAATFSVENLPRLDYILAEDEDIIGFLPLCTGKDLDSDSRRNRTIFDATERSRVHPNEEMLARVLCLLEDGMELCANEDVPIAVVDGTIIYQEDGILASTPSIGMKSLYRPVIDYDEITTPTLPPNAYQDVNSPPDRPISLQVGGGSIIESIAPSESASLNVAMNRMVDSLVGPREPVVSEEEEEEEEQIVFTGRNKRSTPQKAKPQQPERSPITASNGSPQPRRAVQSEPAPPTSSPPPPSQPLPGTQKYVAPGSYTAKDLVNQLHNFTQRLTPNASPLAPRSQPPPPWREPYESSQPVSSIQAPSSFFYESSRNYVDSPSPFLYGSQWTHNTGTPPVAGQPYQSSQPNALG